MYSQLFCCTLEIQSSDSDQKKEDHGFLKIYKIELSKFQETVPKLFDCLSSSERHRAERYHFEKDRNRFIIARTILKFVLSDYTNQGIHSINIETDISKKPYLASHPSIFFNVSHSGDFALIAIADSPIGVDVESINKQFKYEEILKNVFNQIEIDEIANSKDKHLAFYKLWTRKEAIVKAIGKGIDDDVCKIPVTDGHHSVASNLLCDHKVISVFSFSINENYMGALAVTKELKNFEQHICLSIPSPEELIRLIG